MESDYEKNIDSGHYINVKNLESEKTKRDTPNLILEVEGFVDCLMVCGYIVGSTIMTVKFAALVVNYFAVISALVFTIWTV